MIGWTDQFSGYIFMCSGKTKPDCYRYRVFGLPAGRMDVVKKIKPQMKLFLFDFDLKLLYGVYTSSSHGKMGIEPSAFEGKFPAQVKFEIFKECLPLPESVFKHAIKDNYRGGPKFRQELSNEQVTNLVSMFRPLSAQLFGAADTPPAAGLSVSHDQYLAELQLSPSALVSDGRQGQHAHPLFMHVPHALEAHPSTQSGNAVSLATTISNSYFQAESYPACYSKYPTLLHEQIRGRYITGQNADQRRFAQLPAGIHRTAAYWAAVASEDRRHAYVPASVGSVPSHSAVPESSGSGNGSQSVIAKYCSHKLALAEPSLTALLKQAALHGTMHLRSSSFASVEYFEKPTQAYTGTQNLTKESTGMDSGNVSSSHQVAVETRISELVRSLHENMQQSGGMHVSHNDATVSPCHAYMSTHAHVPLQNCVPYGLANLPFSSGAVAYRTGVAHQEVQDRDLVSSAAHRMPHGDDPTASATDVSHQAYAQLPLQDPTALYGMTQWASSTAAAYAEQNQAYSGHYQMLPLSRGPG